jgi:hypothetical protein
MQMYAKGIMTNANEKLPDSTDSVFVTFPQFIEWTQKVALPEPRADRLLKGYLHSGFQGVERVRAPSNMLYRFCIQ